MINWTIAGRFDSPYIHNSYRSPSCQINVCSSKTVSRSQLVNVAPARFRVSPSSVRKARTIFPKNKWRMSAHDPSINRFRHNGVAFSIPGVNPIPAIMSRTNQNNDRLPRLLVHRELRKVGTVLMELDYLLNVLLRKWRNKTCYSRISSRAISIAYLLTPIDVSPRDISRKNRFFIFFHEKKDRGGRIVGSSIRYFPLQATGLGSASCTVFLFCLFLYFSPRRHFQPLFRSIY